MSWTSPLYPPPSYGFDREPSEPPRLRWPWLLMVLVTAAWWPLSTYWLSDDWVILHHSTELGRAAGDFADNWCDARGAVWFYRPLVSLGFALEQLAAGANPWLSHFTNAVCCGLSAMLLGKLAARFFGSAVGFAAGLLWGTSAIHAGVVLWASGRTAGFCEPWLLLCLWCVVRAADGARRGHWIAPLALALALCCKEIAVVAPAAAALLAFSAAEARRWRAGLIAAVPLALVVGAYFALRLALFDRFVGGYTAASWQPVDAVWGLARWTGRLLNPAALCTEDATAQLGIPPETLDWWWLGAAPAVIGAFLLLRRFGAWSLPGLLALYLCSVAPSATLWSGADYAHNARLFSLPLAPVAVVLAGGGWWTALPALALTAAAHLELRADYAESFTAAERTHRFISAEAATLDPGPVLIWGLPRGNEKNTTVLFHVGVDRLLQPPFGDGRHATYALRPLDPSARANQLAYGERRGLPFGATLSLLRGGTGVGLLPPERRPTFEARLEQAMVLDANALTAIHGGAVAPAFVLGAPRAPSYRISLFSAGGYVTAICDNGADAETDGGRVAIADWLRAETGENRFVATDLVLPAAIDLSLRMPVLIEGGTLVTERAGLPPAFAATHHAADWVWLELGEDYATFIGEP